MNRAGLLAVVAMSIPSAAMNGQDLVPVVRDIQPAVVTILTFDRANRVGPQGTGFFVTADGELVTNLHVVAGAYRAIVRLSSGEEMLVRGVTGASEQWDIVRLSVDKGSRTLSFLPVSQSLPDVGSRVVVVGSPLGLQQSVSDGIISAIRDLQDGGQILQLTAPISPGSSGSPVVSLTSREVIGVATASFRGGQNLNVAIPARVVMSLPYLPTQSLAAWSSAREAPDRPALRTDAPHWLNGLRVRVQTESQGLIIGDVHLVSRDTLLLAAGRIPHPVAVQQIRALDVSQGTRTYKAAGGVLGTIVGSVLGVGIAFFDPSCKQGTSHDPELCAEGKLLGFLLGATLGGTGGYYIGAATSRDIWERVPLDRVR